MDDYHSAYAGDRRAADGGVEPDLRSRDSGDAVLAALGRGPRQRRTADYGDRLGVDAGSLDQRDQFPHPLGVAGSVSDLDVSAHLTGGHDELVLDRDVRLDRRYRELHDQQRGHDGEHDSDRGEPDDTSESRRREHDHVCDFVCFERGDHDAVLPRPELRADRMIRPATMQDVPALVAMGQQFAQTEMYRDVLRENPEQMAILAGNLIDHENGAILVLERGGTLVGMIGILCTVHFLSGELCAGEVFWWVTPGHRGDGVRLLKAAESWAMVRGAKTLQMIAPTERVGQFYDRMGFTRIEMSYQKELGV